MAEPGVKFGQPCRECLARDDELVAPRRCWLAEGREEVEDIASNELRITEAPGFGGGAGLEDSCHDVGVLHSKADLGGGGGVNGSSVISATSSLQATTNTPSALVHASRTCTNGWVATSGFVGQPVRNTALGLPAWSTPSVEKVVNGGTAQ